MERPTAQQEFEQFYSATAARTLAALTLTLGDHDLAREAFQEAMVRAWLRWGAVKDYRNPAGWVYTVALNEARSTLRRMRRSLLLRRRLQTCADSSPAEPEMTLDVEAALHHLSREHRAVLVLRFYLGYPSADVAAILDLPEGTVRSRQHWALRHLRDRMEGSNGHRAANQRDHAEG